MEDNSSSATSATLLQRLGQQVPDQAAWEDFVDQYAPGIFSLFRGWGLQESDAQDSTQDVLLRLCKQLRSFQYDPKKGRFRDWLRQVARNVWCDFWKSHQKPGQGMGGPDDPFSGLADFVQELEKTYDLELFEKAQGIVQKQVAADTWEAFRLNKMEDIPAGEVAALLGKEIGTVYQSVFRVIDKLKAEITRLEGHAPEDSS